MNRPCSNRILSWSLGLLALGFWSGFSTTAASKGPAVLGKVDFNHDIRPILAENCYACHGPDEGKRKAKLRLDRKENALGILPNGDFAIVPGDLARSKLMEHISSKDSEEVMPPVKSGKKLTTEQIAWLTRWISEGAPWQNHWSFITPRR